MVIISSIQQLSRFNQFIIPKNWGKRNSLAQCKFRGIIVLASMSRTCARIALGAILVRKVRTLIPRAIEGKRSG